jgi:hypothetical protein
MPHLATAVKGGVPLDKNFKARCCQNNVDIFKSFGKQNFPAPIKREELDVNTCYKEGFILEDKDKFEAEFINVQFR